MRSLTPTLAEMRTSLFRTLVLFDTIDAQSTVLQLHHTEVETYQSICLVRVTLAWESFLEEALLKHLCGCRSVGGNALAGVPGMRSTQQAYQHLLGTKQYLTWNYHATVARYSAQLGANHPWVLAVQAVRQDILDIYAVRNRIAHRSESTSIEFAGVVSRRMGANPPRGMTPGRLLRRQSPTGSSYMRTWTAVIEAAATAIAT